MGPVPSMPPAEARKPSSAGAAQGRQAVAWVPKAIMSASSRRAKRSTRRDGASVSGLVSAMYFAMAASRAGRATAYTPASSSSVVGDARISSKKAARPGWGTSSNPRGGSRISPTRVRRAATCSAHR